MQLLAVCVVLLRVASEVLIQVQPLNHRLEVLVLNDVDLLIVVHLLLLAVLVALQKLRLGRVQLKQLLLLEQVAQVVAVETKQAGQTQA